MKKQIISVACLTLIFFSSITSAQVSQMHVGNTLPQLTFTQMFNHPADSLNTRDLKGKIIIFEFWGTFCLPCLESFPKLDSIQKAYNKQIQIVLVNPEGKEQTKQFFKTHPGVFLPDIPFITADTLLNKMFPHMGNPFSFWIERDGKLAYEDLPVNFKNVHAVIEKVPLEIPEAVKKNFRRTMVESKWAKSVLYSSVILRAEDLGLSLLPPDSARGFADTGSITSLYQKAYEGITNNKYAFYTPGKTILEVKKIDDYVRPEKLGRYYNQQWTRQNFYIYQSRFPLGSEKNIYAAMLEDLERTFPLRGRIEKRKVKSLVLIGQANLKALSTKGGRPEDTFSSYLLSKHVLNKKRLMINQPFTKFSNRIKGVVETKLKYPFFNEVVFNDNIDVSAPSNIIDNFTVENFNLVMKKYGLSLVEKDIEMEVLILSEKDISPATK